MDGKTGADFVKKTERVIDGSWTWKPSKELEGTLKSLGVWDDMCRYMSDIHFATNKFQLETAKLGVESLKSIIAVSKTAFDVHKESGAKDEESGIGEITISLKRHVEEEKADADA